MRRRSYASSIVLVLAFAFARAAHAEPSEGEQAFLEQRLPLYFAVTLVGLGYSAYHTVDDALAEAPRPSKWRALVPAAALATLLVVTTADPYMRIAGPVMFGVPLVWSAGLSVGALSDELRAPEPPLRAVATGFGFAAISYDCVSTRGCGHHFEYAVGSRAAIERSLYRRVAGFAGLGVSRWQLDPQVSGDGDARTHLVATDVEAGVKLGAPAGPRALVRLVAAVGARTMHIEGVRDVSPTMRIGLEALVDLAGPLSLVVGADVNSHFAGTAIENGLGAVPGVTIGLAYGLELGTDR